jgi:hypothetical protein
VGVLPDFPFFDDTMHKALAQPMTTSPAAAQMMMRSIPSSPPDEEADAVDAASSSSAARPSVACVDTAVGAAVGAEVGPDDGAGVGENVSTLTLSTLMLLIEVTPFALAMLAIDEARLPLATAVVTASLTLPRTSCPLSSSVDASTVTSIEIVTDPSSSRRARTKRRVASSTHE